MTTDLEVTQIECRKCKKDGCPLQPFSFKSPACEHCEWCFMIPGYSHGFDVVAKYDNVTLPISTLRPRLESGNVSEVLPIKVHDIGNNAQSNMRLLPRSSPTIMAVFEVASWIVLGIILLLVVFVLIDWVCIVPKPTGLFCGPQRRERRERKKARKAKKDLEAEGVVMEVLKPKEVYKKTTEAQRGEDMAYGA